VAAVTCAVASFVPGTGIPFGIAALLLARLCFHSETQKTRGYVAVFIGVVGLCINLVLLRFVYWFSHIDR
jgi:cytochrome c biogenesis protein CcdA